MLCNSLKILSLSKEMGSPRTLKLPIKMKKLIIGTPEL